MIIKLKTLRTIGAVATFGLALLFAGAPAKADVIINNVFSPFTTIEIVPGHHGYGSGYRAWINSPNHHARCYRRWHPYYQEWSFECRRMYFGGPYERGGYYESGSYGGEYYR